MVRPKKNADEKYSEYHQLAMRPHTHETLIQKSQAVGLGKSEFLRYLIEETPLPSHGSSRAVPALVAALNAYTLELARCGNNLNQLAAATHQERDHAKYWREIGDKFQDDLKKARAELDAVLGEMNL